MTTMTMPTGEVATATGWGGIDNAGTQSPNLKEVLYDNVLISRSQAAFPACGKFFFSTIGPFGVQEPIFL